MDVDGDGDLDLLVGSESGAVQLYRNTGTRTAPSFALDSTFSMVGSFNAIPAVADMDGDGTPELLLGGSGGGVELWRRLGG
jgi:hypothetical protein